MKGGELPVDVGERLSDWREGMHPRLARLQDFELPEDFPFDYSPTSLDRLEAILLERFGTTEELTRDDARGFVEAATGYVGEVLLRAGGGSWAWEEASVTVPYGLPLVRFDDGLGLQAVSPLRLIIQSVRLRTSREFARVHHGLEEAVDARKAEDPSWAPTKELTPGIDEQLELTPPPASLVTWLTERENRFPRWAVEYADDGIWDFSVESLDSLEILVRRTLKSEDEFAAVENQDFVEGAAWYLGEVMRRAVDGHWRYAEGPPDSHNPWVGRPYVRQMVSNGGAEVPILLIEIAVSGSKAGLFQASLSQFKTRPTVAPIPLGACAVAEELGLPLDRTGHGPSCDDEG